MQQQGESMSQYTAQQAQNTMYQNS